MLSLKKISILFLLFLISIGTTHSDENTLFSVEALKANNLVDIQALAPSIGVQLMYATSDNFLGKNVYGNLKQCFLRREAAEKLVTAQKLLKNKREGCSLLVYDGLRPRRIQRMMWDIVKGTIKQQYVANPEKGSIHNYGAAVDLTIADEKGVPLDMGTPFDYFGIKAHPRYESIFLNPELLEKSDFDGAIRKAIKEELEKAGGLTKLQVENRLLLRDIMRQAGFEPIMNEWWHFSAFPNDFVRKKFRIIE